MLSRPAIFCKRRLPSIPSIHFLTPALAQAFFPVLGYDEKARDEN